MVLLLPVVIAGALEAACLAGFAGSASAALVWEQRGAAEKAEHCWKGALRAAHPGAEEVEALLGLGRAKHAQGRLAEAETDFERAVLAVTESDRERWIRSRNHLAALYRDTGRPSQAEPLLQAAIALGGGDHPVLLNNLALVLVDLGEPARAEPLLRRALALHQANLGPLHPETARSAANLASVYLLDRRAAEAEITMRPMMAVWSNSETDPTLRIHGWTQWAAILISAGKLAAAADALAEAQRVAAAPHDPAEDIQIHYTLAGLYGAERNWTRAKSHLTEALAIGRGLYGDHNLLLTPLLSGQAQVLRKLGDRKQAKAVEAEVRAILSSAR